MPVQSITFTISRKIVVKRRLDSRLNQTQITLWLNLMYFVYAEADARHLTIQFEQRKRHTQHAMEIGF